MKYFKTLHLVFLFLVSCSPSIQLPSQPPTQTITIFPILTAVPSKTGTPAQTTTPTETATTTATKADTVTATPVPSETTANFTPAQQALIKKFESVYGKSFVNPDKYIITFDKDNKMIVTDKISGRILIENGKGVVLDPNNTSGKDQLEDGTWVFNNNLMQRLTNEGLDKTHLKGNDVFNDPSSVVDEYTWKFIDKLKSDNPGVLETLVGGLSGNESLVWRSIFLYKFPDGTYSWGLIVSKEDKNTKGWTDNKRCLVYMDAAGNIKYLPIYYPNYLF